MTPFPPPGFEAVIFDMDGVVTQTAVAHAAAWKQLFDDFLRARSERTGEPFREFDVQADYRPYVDGMPRSDGVRRFLASRLIELPEGTPSDPPDAETVYGLGNRKNGYFMRHVEREGVAPFETTVALIRGLRERGIRTAIISASENATVVLTSAGVIDLFDVQVDGTDSKRLGLAGKPDPAIFLEAARELHVQPRHAVVVEDALAGVEAGRAGGFGLVVGIDRVGLGSAMADRGADIVVGDLGELAGA